MCSYLTPQESRDWIKTKGVLRYEPKRPRFKKTHKEATLIVQLPWDDLDVYYHWHLQKKFGSYLTLQRPMWGKHMTVVRGDEKPRGDSWKKLEGKMIEIEYSPDIKLNWQFWSLPVRPSDELQAIRADLGLKEFHNFHITVGRQFDWQPRV
jgi:hypothetical protein